MKNVASLTNDRVTTVSIAFSKDGGKTISKPLCCASISANRFAQLEEDEVQEDTKKSVSTTVSKQEQKTYAFVLAAVCQAPAAAPAAVPVVCEVSKPAAKPVIKKKYNWADVESDSDDE